MPAPADRAPSLSPGAVLAGRFRIVGFLGQGGMGEVYEAEDQELKEQVALKTIRPEIAGDERAIARFKREIHLARRVTHPNVCRIFDLFHHQPEGTSRPVAFLSMELLRGQTLAERLRRGRLARAEAAPIVRQMAAALEAAHQVDVIHRDFKSANVMLVPAGQGEPARAVVTDFGLARHSDTGEGSTVSALTGGIVGTPAYMAPEQVTGGTITRATDVYALGVVIYEMVTGKLPFEGETPLATAVKRIQDPPTPPRAHAPELDPVWESVILRCLEREPAARYASAAEAVNALAAEPAAAAVARPWQLLAAAVTLLLLLGGVLGYYLRQTWKLRETAPVLRTGLPAAPIRPRRSVAVLGFKDLARRPESAWLSAALSEMLTTELAAGEKLRTISGENVARMKIELALAETDSLARDTLARIRINLGTDLVVLGSYTVLTAGGQIRLDLRLQDAAAGEIIASVAETGAEPQLFELVSRTAARLREKLGVGELSAAQAGNVRAARPANPEAARLYAEGVTRLRQYDALAARDLLEKAVAADPKHGLAHSALAAAWSALGYDARARQQARTAYELSAGLSREERLSIEGRYRETIRERDRAIEIYRTLWNFFPDNLDYGLRLAGSQIAARKTKDGLATLEALRKLPGASSDPRLDFTEAKAVADLSDFKRSLVVGAEALKKAEAQGARLLAARARIDYGVALWHLGELPKAVAVLEASKRTFVEAGDRWGASGALNNIAMAQVENSDLKGAKASFEESFGMSQQIGDRAGMARSSNNIAVVLGELGDPLGAKKRYEQALAMYREIDDRNGVAVATGNIARIVAGLGEVAEARQKYHEAIESFRQLGNRSSASWGLNSLGILLAEEGEFDEAKKTMEESLRLRREIGEKAGISQALNNLGGVLYHRGELAECRQVNEESLAIAREAGNKRHASHAQGGLVEVLVEQGDLAGARQHLQEILAQRLAAGEKESAAETRMTLARVAIEEGRAAEAESLARQAAEEFRKAKAPATEGLAHAVLARALLAQGKREPAVRAADRALALARQSRNRRVELSVAIAAGHVRAATQSLETALGEATKRGFVPHQLEARLALGEIEAKSAAGRARLEALEKDAAAKGFVLIARKAAAARR